MTTHSILERLQLEYNEADLQPKKYELVTDEETEAFLRMRNTFWSVLFFIIFAASIILPGVIDR